MGALAVERLIDHAEKYMTDQMFTGDSHAETDFVRCVWWAGGLSWRERDQLKAYFYRRIGRRDFKPGLNKPTHRPDLVAAWVEEVEAVQDGRAAPFGFCPAPTPAGWCGKPLRYRQRTCSAACRQALSRSRRKSTTPTPRRRRRTKPAGQRGKQRHTSRCYAQTLDRPQSVTGGRRPNRAMSPGAPPTAPRRPAPVGPHRTTSA
jgi:hypothetical protein